MVPLTSGDAKPSRGRSDLFTFGVKMTDGQGNIVEVLVSDLAMLKLEPRSIDGDTAFFDRHRSLFESVASKKYDAETRPKPKIVTITSADV